MSTPTTRGDGLKISKATLAQDWKETMKQPAIFEIVCKKSKRRYIGSSTRPDLRRATYWFHMQHVDIYSDANVFFGVKSIKSDIEKYGLDSFEFNIIKNFPDTITAEDLKLERQVFIDLYPESKLYNRRIFWGDAKMSIYSEICPEMNQLEKDIRALEPEVKELHSKFQNVLMAANKSREKLDTLYAAGKIKHVEYFNGNKHITQINNLIRKPYQEKSKLLKQLKQRKKDLHVELTSYYKQEALRLMAEYK